MRKQFFKNGFLLTVLSLATTVSIISCNKEENLQDNNSIINTKEVVDEETIDDELVYEFDVTKMEHYYNGDKYGNLKDMNPDSIVSIVYQGSIYYFDKDRMFYDFCDKNDITGFYKRSKDLDKIYSKAVELGIQDRDYENINDVPNDMKKYWYSVFGSEFGTFPEDKTESKLTWGLAAYDAINYTKDKKSCVGPTYWSLGNFNKKTSSFKVYNTGIGGIWWCYKKWYGKPRIGYFLIGIPIGRIGWPNLREHNDEFCSYCTTLH